MRENEIGDAALHYQIIKFFVDFGYAPQTAELAVALAAEEDAVEAALYRLAQNHGVVLHPHSARIWVAHPFSAAPTNFLVHCPGSRWWGNCAWCSLGVAALLKRDVTITTTLGADGRQVDLHIKDGRVVETDFVVHFPVPMRHAWDNVIYTCSTMLLFESEQQVERWCADHRIPQGDVQPVETIWEFSKVWYGNHLNPDWHKWTNDEAWQIFAQFGLEGPVWEIPTSAARF
jgi:hypothetical protein